MTDENKTAAGNKSTTPPQQEQCQAKLEAAMAAADALVLQKYPLIDSTKIGGNGTRKIDFVKYESSGDLIRDRLSNGEIKNYLTKIAMTGDFDKMVYVNNDIINIYENSEGVKAAETAGCHLRPAPTPSQGANNNSIDGGM